MLFIHNVVFTLYIAIDNDVSSSFVFTKHIFSSHSSTNLSKECISSCFNLLTKYSDSVSEQELRFKVHKLKEVSGFGTDSSSLKCRGIVRTQGNIISWPKNKNELRPFSGNTNVKENIEMPSFVYAISLLSSRFT
jgi:hypothetical protein